MTLFKRYLQLYLDTCSALGYTERTRAGRESMLLKFIDWCEERAVTDPRQITRPMLERYRRYLYHYRQPNGKPLGLASQRNRLTPVKGFFRWLTQENHILHNPASELQLPRPHQRLPKAILTAEEVERVLKQTLLYGETGRRDRAILETFYATGIRRMELANLKRDDIDIEQQTLMIREGKGKKDRLLPIGERACAWINEYVMEVRPQLAVEPDRGYLFLNASGNPFNPHQLSDLARSYLRRAGIKKEGACHLFRHTMATLMLEHGADIRFIQAMLGHADLSTTQLYTRVSITKLKEVYQRTHPAHLKTGQQTTDAAAPTAEDVLEQLAREADEDE